MNQLRHGQSKPDLRLVDCSLIPTTWSLKWPYMGISSNFAIPNQLVSLQFSILCKAYDLGIRYNNLQTQRYVERLILAIVYLHVESQNQSSPSIPTNTF